MITDVEGLLVGHATRLGEGWATGVTAVICPPGTVGAVDVRGGGPGTHETDALAPGTLVEHVNAVTLCGGSAFGLVAAHGVQRWCEEHDRGFPVGADPDGTVHRVPIVPAAAIFDLGRGGDWSARPDAQLGYAAAVAARSGAFARGRVGAGTGARTCATTEPGGIGTATIRLAGDLVVSALVVLNAAGRVLTGEGSGTPGASSTGAGSDPTRRGVDPKDPGSDPTGDGFNTTLAVVATNARLDVAAATRMAGCGHDGLARTISPVHTLTDGDTVYALATGRLDPGVAGQPDAHWPGARSLTGLVAVQSAAADAVAAAVLDAWHQSRSPLT